MKKGLLYLLLFSYTTIILKPVMPSVSDFIAHTFWYSQHMATVHLENGKYHVHYEYMAESKKNLPEKNNAVSKSGSFGNDHIITTDRYDFSIDFITKKKFLFSSFHLPHRSLHGDYPPPRA